MGRRRKKGGEENWTPWELLGAAVDRCKDR